MRIAAIVIAATAACSSTPPSLEPVTIDDPRAHWALGGFVEMVPEIRLPTSRDGMDTITVWLRVPEDRRIDVRALADGRVVPVYPAGTIADRVELVEPADGAGEHLWRVSDVRGTELDGDGEVFHCLRPDGDRLAGFAWRRGDARAEQLGADRLFAGAPRLRQLARCESCHDHDRREHLALAEPGPRRATDDAGFYGVLSVLADTAPLEDHRPRDLEAGDPYVAITRSPSTIGIAHADVARAVAADRPHEQAVCRSRRYLYEHMTEAAREAFAKQFADCAIHE